MNRKPVRVGVDWQMSREVRQASLHGAMFTAAQLRPSA
jgi:hypothetical protein